ncbi:hypothetical protein TPHA_0E00860 [Tetrapisispora phaffii CBS 4417]|uniref:Enoyl reductase (ER) domain-containing protein n=1 Tax=Tetrapisispora phaffii (strain ATCC 24235 / CBS 4417 / NBRC 1672 / NRRL Y-8282 / UCD 70-5) TaxID=1071381 RepID=G8BTF3_TETPH|nr:hypothetical protein TPHA_0E00860 [Tetrapisispora phaffii CBS 4417]CCE63181.1 hypothetical protein TPHA_0E00860 [Tetrapisispora phaffii CBS 4417]
MSISFEKQEHKLDDATIQGSEIPKEIPTGETVLHRVARPVRHVKNIPVKALVFSSKEGPMLFTYDRKIRTPIPKNKLVVQVAYAGLNPIDMKIKNGYKSGSFYGDAGVGREYFGTIISVGEDIASKNTWREGDEVMGIYYHPHSGNGALQSSILIDPKVDPIMLKPATITMPEAGGTLYCLGAAYQILKSLDKAKVLKPDSNILINGGTTSVGMFVLQLLKNHYHLVSKVSIVTTGTGSKVLKNHFPSFASDLIFIDYLTCRGKASKPLRKMLEEKVYTDFNEDTQEETTQQYTQGKYDIVFDFVGGYDILAHSSALIHSGGQYVTTVGDYVSDYKNDVFETWDNPSANARKIFGAVLWSYTYTHFNFNPNYDVKWIKEVAEILEKREVKCIVDKVYEWKDFKEAFSYLSTQRSQGKLILKVEKF